MTPPLCFSIRHNLANAELAERCLDAVDNLPETMKSVYASPVCDTIDDYNTGAYYEPSYVQTRAFLNGGF